MLLYSFLWVSSLVLTTVLIGIPKLCLAGLNIQCDGAYDGIVTTAIEEALKLIEGVKALDPDQDYTDKSFLSMFRADTLSDAVKYFTTADKLVTENNLEFIFKCHTNKEDEECEEHAGSPAYTDASHPNDDGTFNTIICVEDIPHLMYESITEIPATKSNCGMKWPSRMEDVLAVTIIHELLHQDVIVPEDEMMAREDEMAGHKDCWDNRLVNNNLQNENQADCYAIYTLAYYMGPSCGQALGLEGSKTWGAGAPSNNPCWPRGNNPPLCPETTSDSSDSFGPENINQSDVSQLILEL